MSNTEYNPDNIFKAIIDGDAPCVKVYEDQDNVAFMDIYPESKGHVLVVPKTMSCDFLGFPTHNIGTYLECVQKIARAVKAALNPDGIKIMQYNGAEASQTVFHTHFHIVPCYANIPLVEHSTVSAETEKLQIICDAIKKEIPTGGDPYA
jgi:histidine triad (HIT) family protein